MATNVDVIIIITSSSTVIMCVYVCKFLLFFALAFRKKNKGTKNKQFIFSLPQKIFPQEVNYSTYETISTLNCIQATVYRSH